MPSSSSSDPSKTGYVFPPTTLLKELFKSSKPPVMPTDEEHAAKMAALVRILGDLGITVTPGEIHAGVSITCYEVAPALGIDIAKIAELGDEIASRGGFCRDYQFSHINPKSVRIIAPMPGKNTVGIELPNKTKTHWPDRMSLVSFSEILASEDWKNHQGKIPLIIGKDISGRPLIIDLTRMPHLFVTGSPMSGRHECMYSIIASIALRQTPNDVRLLLLDNHFGDLAHKETLPHALVPAIPAPDVASSAHALAAFQWLHVEIKRRRLLFTQAGVRDIYDFNNRNIEAAAVIARQQTSLENCAPVDTTVPALSVRLPRIVVIVEGFDQLMLSAAAQVEAAITRLAPLASTAGIHMIISTSYPATNVISSLIKANIPSRIAFHDNYNNIFAPKDTKSLIGLGDMLFVSKDAPSIIRAQVAHISCDELTSVVEYIKRNNPPNHDKNLQTKLDALVSELEEAEKIRLTTMSDEELFKESLNVVKSTRRVSTEMILDKFKIGIDYNRASRIMDMLQERGMVGPETDSEFHDVLVNLNSPGDLVFNIKPVDPKQIAFL